MTTDAVTPLRQRMIDDMNARKLGAHSQRSHIYSCKRLAASADGTRLCKRLLRSRATLRP